MTKLICAVFVTLMSMSAFAQQFNLGKGNCKGMGRQGTWVRDVFFQGQGFSLWNPNDRYEQGIYDMNEYQVLPSGNIRGERRGESGFNKFHYIVEASQTMVRLWEISIPHYNNQKITHYAECVLQRPLSAQQFEDLKRQVL
jgi:hypothetical protein